MWKVVGGQWELMHMSYRWDQVNIRSLKPEAAGGQGRLLQVETAGVLINWYSESSRLGPELLGIFKTLGCW